jgi:hypothetical protein
VGSWLTSHSVLLLVTTIARGSAGNADIRANAVNADIVVPGAAMAAMASMEPLGLPDPPAPGRDRLDRPGQQGQALLVTQELPEPREASA